MREKEKSGARARERQASRETWSVAGREESRHTCEGGREKVERERKEREEAERIQEIHPKIKI